VFVYFSQVETAEGSDDPHYAGGMPMWLWQNIRSVLYAYDVDPSAEIYVKLCNVEE
jgi:hypothetical protein